MADSVLCRVSKLGLGIGLNLEFKFGLEPGLSISETGVVRCQITLGQII